MAYKQQKSISHCLEAGNSKVKVLTDSVSGLQIAVFLLCPLIAGGAKELCEISFMRALVPFTRKPFSWPNHLPHTSPPKQYQLEIQFLHMNSGDINIQSTALPWCISQKSVRAFVSWTVTHVCASVSYARQMAFIFIFQSLEQSLGHLENIQKFDEWIIAVILKISEIIWFNCVLPDSVLPYQHSSSHYMIN